VTRDHYLPGLSPHSAPPSQLPAHGHTHKTRSPRHLRPLEIPTLNTRTSLSKRETMMKKGIERAKRAKRDTIRSKVVASPESDDHRGRKRHRSLTRDNLTATQVGNSGQSATLRGRPPRRSTSPMIMSSRNSSRSLSPTRKKLLQVVLLERRRSQSPSRSRSPNYEQQQPARRRQRTKSRSRSHDKTTSHRPVDASGLRHEIFVSSPPKNANKS
jgi:hypothetical protein